MGTKAAFHSREMAPPKSPAELVAAVVRSAGSGRGGAVDEAALLHFLAEFDRALKDPATHREIPAVVDAVGQLALRHGADAVQRVINEVGARLAPLAEQLRAQGSEAPLAKGAESVAALLRGSIRG